MHEKKLENLLSLSPQKRMEYSIRIFADFELVWGLSIDSTDWIVFNTPDGEMFPIWPHKELAEYCMFDEHRELGAKPTQISLSSFVNNCIPNMIEEAVSFSIFMDKNRQGLFLTGLKLESLIRQECMQHE